MDTPNPFLTRLGNRIARHPFVALAIVGIVVAILAHAGELFFRLLFADMRLDI